MEPGPTVGPRSTVLGRRMLRLLGDYTRGVDHCRVASGLSPLACLRTTKDHFRGSDDEKRQLSAEFKTVLTLAIGIVLPSRRCRGIDI